MLGLSFILFQCSSAMFILRAQMAVSDYQIAIMETVKPTIETAVVTLTKAIHESGMGPRYERGERVTQSPESGFLQYGVDVLAEVREIVDMIHNVLNMARELQAKNKHFTETSFQAQSEKCWVSASFFFSAPLQCSYQELRWQ